MERGGRGLNAPSSSPGPGGDSHALATQLLIKAPATKCPDNYVATHRAPRLRAARAAEGLSARRGAAQPGRAQPRSRASTSPAAEPSRAEPGRTGPSRAEPNRAEPSRAQRRRGSGRGRLGAAARVGLHRVRAPAASALLPSAASSGGASLSQGKQLPLRALTLRLLLRHFSIPHAPAASCHRLSPTWRRRQRRRQPEPKSRLGNSAPAPPPRARSFPSSQRSPLRASWEM